MVDLSLRIDTENLVTHYQVKGDPDIHDAIMVEYSSRSAAKFFNHGVIMDLHNCNPSCIRLLEIDLLFKDHLDKIDSTLKEIPVAYIFNPNHEQFFKFLMLSWTKYKINFQKIENINEALKWLKTQLR